MLTLILMGSCLVIGGLVFFEWQYSQSYQTKLASDLSETKASTVEIEEIPTLNEIIKPIGLYDEVVNRPLFVEGRKPIESVEEDTLTSFNGKKLGITLKGIVSIPDGMIALLEDKEKKRYRLRMGDEVEGWEIAELQTDKVILKKNGEQKELLLWIPKPKKKDDKKNAKSKKKLRNKS